MEDLILAAKSIRDRAYAPYSNYRVGCALRDDKDQIHVGVNVENVSYGLTICAERNAIGAMLAAGGSKITKIAVVTQDGGSPCGACRQVIAEFSEPDCEIYGADERLEIVHRWTAQELLPQAFQSRTEVE